MKTINSISGAFALMAKSCNRKCSKLGLCLKALNLYDEDRISQKVYHAVSELLAEYSTYCKVALLWPIGDQGEKNRKAFCLFMAKQRFPLSRKVFQEAAEKFKMRKRN